MTESNQRDLFTQDAYPTIGRSRKKDPATSKQAADKNKSGLNKQGAKVLAAIKAMQGGTRGEIGKYLAAQEGIEFHQAIAQVSRRAPDLALLNLVKRGDFRKCSVLGSNQTTWYAKEIHQD